MQIKIPGYPNQQFYYEIHGKGLPILVLHGWNGSSATWQDFLKLKNENFQWIIPDLPGFGQSPPPQTPWTVSDYKAWAEAFYNSLPNEIKPHYLLTHSFGGRIAAKWLSEKDKEHPFKKAILAAAAGLLPKATLKQKVAKLLSYFQNIIPIKWQTPIRKIFYKILRIHDYPVDPIMQKTFKNVVQEDLADNFSQINIPVKLVWGAKDYYTPIYMATALTKIIPNNDLVVLPEIKHGIHRQAPQELANICSEFFKQ